MPTLQNPGKVGIGGWETGDPMNLSAPGVIYAGVKAIGFHWYYTWHPIRLVGDDGVIPFLPTFWSPDEETPTNLASARATNNLIIGYNEPWNSWNAWTPSQALDAWPALMALGNRLACPSFAVNGSPEQWITEFMNGIQSRGYRVDVMNMHFYGSDQSTFRAYIDYVHGKWGRPIVVSEWCKSVPGADGVGITVSERQAGIFGEPRFSFAEQGAYATECTFMMDTLDYVERQSWFAATEGGGFYLNSGVIYVDGSRTPVGDAFLAMLGGPGTVDNPPPPPPPPPPPDPGVPAQPTISSFMNGRSLIPNPDQGTLITAGTGPLPTYSAILNASNITRRT